MLASPHCWVLGPPTPRAGCRPFTTSQGRASTGDLFARKACTRDGSVASRSVPATRPARLLAGAGRAAVNPKRILRSIVLGKQSGCCCQFLVIRRRASCHACEKSGQRKDLRALFTGYSQLPG